VGHAGSSVTLSQFTSRVGQARERRTGRSQCQRAQRRQRGALRITELPAWPTSGIGRFRVQLPAGTVAEISLSYDASRPFPRLEGVQVMGRAGDTVPGVRPDGVNRIRFMAGDTPLDMTVIVIDYYR